MTQDPTQDAMWGAFAQEAENADKAGERLYFGQLTFGEPRYIHWKRDNEDDPAERVVITREQFAQISKSGDRQMEVCFQVNVSEFRPDWDWTHERFVAIKGGNTDWNKVVKPSLVALLGKKAMENEPAALQSLAGKYVQVADVPQVRGGDYSTIKFMAIYPDRDACFSAWNERFGENAQTASQPTASAPVMTQAFPSDVYGAYQAWVDTVPSIKEALAQPGATVASVAQAFAVTPNWIVKVQNGDYD